MKKIIIVCIVIASMGFALAKSRFEKLELFSKVLYLIESQYYRKVDTGKLIQGALKGMMSTLDPHSSFLDPNMFSKMQEDTKGEFGGIGIEVSIKDGIIIIVTPIDDTPAYKAGIQPGDQIVEINYESTLGFSLQEAVDKMRGKSNTIITLGIKRESEPGIKRYSIKRRVIKIKAVKSEIVQKEFMYVRLIQFQKGVGNSISDHLRKMRKKIMKKKRKVKGVVLDLRSNPGGLLDEAVNVSSIFMKDGIVVSTEGRDPKSKEIRYVKKSGYKETSTPLVVLINGSSASASEIVAGAIQDSNRGLILGTRSFGKGSVQTIAKIDEDKGVKLTIAQYMTPNNRKIQAIGIMPDIEVDDVDLASSNGKIYLREKDLRNHLTATIETEKEKRERIHRERIERMERIKQVKADKKRQKEKVSKSKSRNKKVRPSEDFQIMQAVNYLKSIKILKKLSI